MKRREQVQNFIIYLFLATLFLTGAGMGFEENAQVFFSCQQENEAQILETTISTSDEIHIFQVRRSHAETTRISERYQEHSRQLLRMGYLFLFVLAVLSVYFQLVQKTYVFYDRLYVKKRYVMLTFIHDADGRKRFA